MWSAHVVRLALAVWALTSFGCSSRTYLMPTPNVYTDQSWNPFAEVPPALQGDEVAVLYVTDRALESREPDQWEYGNQRSRSAAFGETIVQIGEGETWDELVAASRTQQRTRKLALDRTATREIARFGKAPPVLILTAEQLGARESEQAAAGHAEAEQKFRDEIAARLATSPIKDVFIYVHGHSNTFEDAAYTTAELWHFFGRQGVPICYTWPAGIGGIRAYEYSLASTDFTIYHFKQVLRLIASCPDVQRVNILAHSRGTDVTISTIRELHLETRGGADTQQTLKLGTVALAAADIDLDVVIARNATERIARAVERTAIYIAKEDKALSFSNWLFAGIGRLGELDLKLFEPAEVAALRGNQRLQIIDARAKKRGSFGHSYFHANTAVSSDLVLLMRYGLLPGAEHGRPLDIAESGLWVIEDGYPGSSWQLPPQTTGSNGR